LAILGISGSPFAGGSTDRLVKAVLEKSGKEAVFINLSKLSFDPCRGCCHLCATTNMCGRKDELHPYNLLGHIYFNSQITPCLKCGAGSYCRVGGLWKYILDQDENKLKEFEFTPDKFKKWEDCPQIVKEVGRYGKILAKL
jgi:hypothetical protein